MSTYHPLHDGWTLSGGEHAGVPATVPGCVHTDLLAAGLIDDPYLDDNELRQRWIGRTDWEYRTTFGWSAAPGAAGPDRVDLVCDGLDTVATVTVNDVEVLHTANMHRGYRADVTTLLRPGDNTLRIRFTAPYTYAEAHRAALGERPGPYPEPFQFIRKMACNFGWDWGPTLVTAGIWQRIGLHAWSGVRLAEVRPLATVDGGTGRVEVPVRVERTGDEPVTVTAEIAGVSAELRLGPGEHTGVLVLEVPDVRLWWPAGHGDQPRYPLTVRAGADTWTRRIGFRTVELDPDAFRLTVNGRPVFVKGFNWIPDDCFPARVTADRLRARVGQALDAGANLLRVWGGGRYESDDFYDLADELGVLVWQDFLFACAAYPEDEPFRGEVEAEAREQVTRLVWRPSLVLWCGNNENIWGHQHWGWPEALDGRSWGAGFYHDLLPRVVAELDPTRPYWPGTPYSGSPDRDVMDDSTGTIHIWDVWNTKDYTRYDAYTPRFVAEFGFQAPPTWATLRAAVSDEPLTAASPGVRHHQKAADGDDKLLRGLGRHLPAPADVDDWHYFTQLNQARAVAYGLERFRSLMPYCMGAVVWQLNDCWPVTSWAAVDGAGRRKPLWYAIRRAYAPRLLTVAGGVVTAVNDTDEPWTGDLTVTRRAVTGELLAKESVPVSVAPRDAGRVVLPAGLAEPADPGRELLVAELGEQRALRMFAEDPDMAYPPAAYDTTVEAVDGGYLVHVTARTLLRELAIHPDRLDPDATVDDQLVTLLPGETTTVAVTSHRPLDPARLVGHPVLRCVNEVRS
ncbi:glycoside hydrolase family 2 protein [Dactylosporangium aurantiacum]|uniref:beta-mannosidase n=1 Tax=Dactylosporangium aurantiacum TaxID=35754 RepID=A0A9Q9ISB5_9ACTN|nr:glycoside hydrolase family 2 protein [Dactylosporangium aurantiacum]MDG6109908.1 glycoside hydrolase family 2 protein [Dactylosporangium aurantiacum]UWZ58093.1 glycoside hydrolase family 2 protein [Dactylosporangium aurantiacum]